WKRKIFYESSAPNQVQRRCATCICCKHTADYATRCSGWARRSRSPEKRQSDTGEDASLLLSCGSPGTLKQAQEITSAESEQAAGAKASCSSSLIFRER